jgi:hypothetical protein
MKAESRRNPSAYPFGACFWHPDHRVLGLVWERGSTGLVLSETRDWISSEGLVYVPDTQLHEYTRGEEIRNDRRILYPQLDAQLHTLACRIHHSQAGRVGENLRTGVIVQVYGRYTIVRMADDGDLLQRFHGLVEIIRDEDVSPELWDSVEGIRRSVDFQG